MKERLKVLNFKYNVVVFTFVFFLIISVLSPLSGLDWGNYVKGSEGLVYIFNNLSFTYGGYITSILTSLFAYNKLIFNFTISLLFSLLIKNVNDLYGKTDNKYYYLIIPFLLLCVGVSTFALNYTSVMGSVSSTIPSILIIIYFIYLYKKELNIENLSIKDIIILIILSILIIMDSFYLGIGFFLGSVLLYIYGVISNKVIKKKYLILLLVQFAFIVLNVFLCNKEFLYDSITTMVNNIPSYIDATFSKNILLFIIGAIPINYYLNDILKNYTYKRVIIVLFDSLLLFSLAYNFVYYSPVNLNLVINKYKGVFALENIYYIVYFIIYMFLYGLTIIHFSKKRTLRNYMLLLVFSSLFVTTFKIFSPSYEDGNNIFFIFSMVISTGIILDFIDFKINVKVLKTLFVLLLVYYIGFMSMIKYIDYTRTKYIEEQLDASLSVIEVRTCPFYFVYRYNPITIFEEKDFRLYYNIPNSSIIDVKSIGKLKEIKESVVR